MLVVVSSFILSGEVFLKAFSKTEVVNFHCSVKNGTQTNHNLINSKEYQLSNLIVTFNLSYNFEMFLLSPWKQAQSLRINSK